jgi:hypothetical protein
VLEELSLAVSISSDMQKLQKVIDENEQLRDHNNKLESDAEKHMQEQSAKITRNSYLFAILIAINWLIPCWDVTSKERFAVVRMSFSVSKNHTLTSSRVISESESL